MRNCARWTNEEDIICERDTRLDRERVREGGGETQREIERQRQTERELE